ncbi:sulfatase-like hydrolase/transferase [Saccharicrinis sp. 156]|uniref:sulfatase-like hydrolase/transferase n=1 Tax=Saccharicrinis sp. 156 TaxID=3417574 RepID=UPI003D33F557
MKKFLITGLLGLILTISLNAQNQKKPNVLFIFADDQTFESIGSLNNNEIKTPNLDRLKDMGATFTHTFNQGSWCPAVCVASRCMLNTGKFVWRAAQYSKNAQPRGDKNLPENMPKYTVGMKTPKGYWPEFMKAEGYDTYFAGKWHVERKANEIFDVTGTVRGGMPNQTRERYDRKFIEGESDTWSPYDKSKNGFWKGGKHWSEVLGDEALGFLETAKNDNDPFFMYVAFNAPHDPRQSPKKYVDMYPVENISIPENFLPEYPYCEEAGSGHKLRDEKLAPYPRTEYSIQVNRQEYYAIITHMDDQIGRILNALEASGKAKNTYVIFTADHGLALGDHGFVGKQNMYDRSIRVPMFVAGPGIEGGKVIDEKVYLQDAMATSLDIAGSKAIDEVDFKSLLPLSQGKTKKGYDAIYGAYVGNQRMIRTDRYKMIIYPLANMVRLYDIKNDPDEINDLAGNMKYKKVMDKLFKQFKELQKEVEDPLDVTEYYVNFFSRN